MKLISPLVGVGLVGLAGGAVGAATYGADPAKAFSLCYSSAKTCSVYYSNASLGIGHWTPSEYQASLSFNSAQFSNAFNEDFGLTYCYANDSCYASVANAGGTVTDSRTISYGRAWCGTPHYDGIGTHVNQCFTYAPHYI